jgi:SNF2 family DNA or RNA helicase
MDKIGLLPGVMIANDMGTGKTVEALWRDELIRDLGGNGCSRTLVVTPMSVIPTWEDHCEMFDLLAKSIDPKDRARSWDQFINNPYEVFIVHWEALRLMPELLTVRWMHVIADECHRMQNRKAQMTQAIKKIPTSYRTAMSGTPTTGHPEKFWSSLNWIDKKQFGSFWKFYAEHVEYDVKLPQGYHVIKGPKNVPALLAKIEPYYVRRTKEEVLPDLPDKYYDKIWVDLSPVQRKAYNQMKNDMVAWVNKQGDTPLIAPAVIAQLVRLQQFAVSHAEVTGEGVRLSEPSSKLDALMDILEDNPDKQFVVFSNFKQLITLLEARLKKEGITYGLLTGDVDQRDRGRAVSDFQSKKTRLFIGTVQAGGVGITLTAASTVIFLDRNWSPALNLQAEDRLHRIGQAESVQVIDIMAKNTVDRGRFQTIEMKHKWIQQLLGDI